MKYLTAILCTAILSAAIIYHAKTRPGRFYFPNDWNNLRAADTATGRMYLSQTNSNSEGTHFFFMRSPAEELPFWNKDAIEISELKTGN